MFLDFILHGFLKVPLSFDTQKIPKVNRLVFEVRPTAQVDCGHGDSDGLLELSTASGSSSTAPSILSTSVSSAKDERLQRVAEQLLQLKMAVDKQVSKPHEKGFPQTGSSSKVADEAPPNNMVGGGNMATSSKTKPSEMIAGSTKAGKSENEYVLPAHVPCLRLDPIERLQPMFFVIV